MGVQFLGTQQPDLFCIKLLESESKIGVFCLRDSLDDQVKGNSLEQGNALEVLKTCDDFLSLIFFDLRRYGGVEPRVA